MKNKNEKYFDAVQMVRDIRDAMYRQRTDPNFKQSEFDEIKAKWTNLLEQQEKIHSYKSRAS
ncbi:MAG: hypothetical protein EPN82_10845 [Bacteroidetes bacterium]|nr:MAG: hypothetical protein EPN82_10845 [Bacteroidota bacterium]